MKQLPQAVEGNGRQRTEKLPPASRVHQLSKAASRSRESRRPLACRETGMSQVG